MLIRPANSGDRDEMYRICLVTGAGGSDATGLYRYPSLLGDVFVGPYLALSPQFCFVVDSGGGAAGYVLGALDSREFALRCAADWWPARREEYRLARPVPGDPDSALLHWVANPPPVPEFVDLYPSHLHIDILPTLQGGGWGRLLLTRLFDTLRAQGSIGVHLGVAVSNDNARGFYRHLGFRDIDGDERTIWMGLDLG